MESVDEFRLTKSQKIIYGSGRFGSTVLLTLISLATFYLYKNVYGIDDILNGYANGIGKIAIAISGFVMGYISDVKIHPKLGRRRPFIISGSILLAFSFVMLYFPNYFVNVSDQIALFTYEAVWLAAFNFFYGYLLTPYQAWLPEITRPDERVEVSGYENLFNVIGNIVGTGGAFAIPLVAKSNPTILYQFVIIVAIVEILFYIPPYLKIQEPKIYIKQPDLIKDIKIIVSNKNYINWIVSRGIMSMGHTIMLTILLNFLSDYLKLADVKYVLTALSLMIIIMAAFAMWYKLSKKFKIKKPFIISGLLLSIPLFLLVTLAALNTLEAKQNFAIVLLTIGAIGLSGYWIYNYAILANIIDADTKARGESRAGSYTGFDNIILNIFQATGYVLTGYILGIFGESLGYVLWGPIAGLFVFIGTMLFALTVNPEPE